MSYDEAREAAYAENGEMEGSNLTREGVDRLIDAFLAALSEDGDLVERVAKAIDDAINAGPSRETWSAKDGEMEISDRIARAAIATLK